MGDVPGNRYLSGSAAEVYYNGLKILGCTKISIKITCYNQFERTGYYAEK